MVTTTNSQASTAEQPRHSQSHSSAAHASHPSHNEKQDHQPKPPISRQHTKHHYTRFMKPDAVFNEQTPSSLNQMKKLPSKAISPEALTGPRRNHRSAVIHQTRRGKQSSVSAKPVNPRSRRRGGYLTPRHTRVNRASAIFCQESETSVTAAEPGQSLVSASL
jgi:hypothetical protein